MDLLEYQAKELFQQAGIPVLPSQRIDHPSQLKRLKIPYPVALKSQVRGGGRGKVGGVRFADNTIDAIAAAQVIFGLTINGERPRALLAEAKYQTSEEYYLAIRIDPARRRPLLLGSCRGGLEIDDQAETIEQVIVDSRFAPYYARRLGQKMGLQGSLLWAVADVVEKMYSLLEDLDLDLIEINPLGVSSTEEVMALDGKVVVNSAALGRQRHYHNTWILTDADHHPWEMRLQKAGMRWIEMGIPSNPRDQRDQPQDPVGMILVSTGSGLMLSSLDRLIGIPVVGCLLLPDRGDVESLGQGLELLREHLALQTGSLVIGLDWVGCFASPDEVLPLLLRFQSKLERLPIIPQWHLRSVADEWDDLAGIPVFHHWQELAKHFAPPQNPQMTT